MRCWVGVDVGMEGALAVLDDTGRAVVFDMPIGVGRNGRNEYDPAAIVELLGAGMPPREWLPTLGVAGAPLTLSWSMMVGIEVTLPRPRPGATEGQSHGQIASWRAGYSAGVFEGICAGLRHPCVRVMSSAWKRVYGFSGQPKDAVRLEAARRWPDVALRRKKDVGRADALFIALYVKEREEGAQRRVQRTGG